MGVLDNTVSTAKEVIGTVGKKTSEVVEAQRIKWGISDRKSKISRLYTSLGEMYYQSVAGKGDLSEAVDIIRRIREKQSEIEELEAQLAALKNMRRCPSCGAVNNENASFCDQCGEKLTFTFDLNQEKGQKQESEEL